MSILPPVSPSGASLGGTPTSDPARDEQQQATLAQRSPLSLSFELVACEYANMTWEENRAIPTYTFHPPCPFGKTIPDQDCRDCAHVRFHPIGQEQHVAAHRYHRHGMIVPVTEEDADAIMDAATARGTAPLGRPQWVHYFRRQEAEAEARRQDQDRARDLERRQMGTHATRQVVEE